jgi:Spy/CpxP family protein refolding chaperone
MTKLVVLIGFCVAFAAGLTVGISRGRMQHQQSNVNAPPTTHPSHRGFLTAELNLTPEQQTQLSTIWSDVAHGGRNEQDKQRQQLREQRDAEILALIPAQDKEKYEKAVSDYREQTSAMDREMRARFQDAVEKTKGILTPEQRAKYEEILSRHQFGGPGGPGRGERGRDRETTRRSAPATQPTAQ